jgi:alkanesulfonate monooxygenase SsuD/methylene tetrahydromethanopterin reductase-like flavin-dependent oxidoreductase (luciferase family)
LFLNPSTFSSLTFALIMELGISTFVELTPDPVTGKTISAYQRFQNLMEEIELADQLGLDVFAIGEHHRQEYLVSSPVTVLAAAAVKQNK